MSPLNSDHLNDMTAEGQGQGQGWGQGQEGQEGGRSSHIRILSTHCRDTDRTVNSRTCSGTGPGRQSGVDSMRASDTIIDSNHNTYTDCSNDVTRAGAGAKNRVRDSRITDTFLSCPDHFRPFYLS